MQNSEPDYYAVLGLDHQCTDEQIKAAYRILSKRFHPDVNHGEPDSVERTRILNAAYEVLGEPEKRLAYDNARAARNAATKTKVRRAGKTASNVPEDVHLRIEDFLRGTSLDVKVNDPGNVDGPEVYQLIIPPETAPGTRFRVPRLNGEFVVVRTRALPGFRFKVRGSDLRCDLRINAKRAAQGGPEVLAGATGSVIRVPIPAGVASGEVIRIPGEGLPRPRGGRGDLLVRIMYRPDVKISRSSR